MTDFDDLFDLLKKEPKSNDIPNEGKDDNYCSVCQQDLSKKY